MPRALSMKPEAVRKREQRVQRELGWWMGGAWVSARAVEGAIAAGAITPEGSENPARLARLAALTFYAMFEPMSRRDTGEAPGLPISERDRSDA